MVTRNADPSILCCGSSFHRRGRLPIVQGPMPKEKRKFEAIITTLEYETYLRNI